MRAITITSDTYAAIARRLEERIAGRDYVSTEVEIEVDEAAYCLELKASVYWRDQVGDGEPMSELADIQSAWNELHTYTDDGEVLNDFQFTELRNHLIG